jgi:hypothetical protein
MDGGDDMTITAEPTATGYVLYADGLGGKSIAGPRLFRGEPWPEIKWSHETKEGAERDAAVLQKYLDGLPAKKKGKRKSTATGAYSD